MIRRLTLIGLALGVVACTVGPDYAAPELDQQGDWVAAASTDAGPPAARPGWWQSLDDPLLDELVTAALADNLDLAAAAARVREAEARVRVAVVGVSR